MYINCKRFFSLLTMLVMIMVASCSFAENGKYEGDGFNTPEEAVSNYIDGLKNLDLSQILRSFAIETRVEKETLEKSLSRMGAYYSNQVTAFPNDGSFLTDINIELIKGDIVNSISRSMFAVLHSDYEDSLGSIIGLKGGDEIEKFVNGFDMDMLNSFQSISNVLFISPDLLTDGKYSIDSNIKYREKLRDAYGAEEYTDLAATFSVGNDLFLVTPGLVKYDGKWYIYSMIGSLSSMIGTDIYHAAFRKAP